MREERLRRPSSYNLEVFRLFCVSLLAMVLLTSCESGMKDKAKVQAAILDRLRSHSGLDLKSLDVNTTAVSFERNMAYATVSFHPKGDPVVNSGMSMKYTLEVRDGKWVVTKVGDSEGHGMMGGMPGSGALPPGHPGVNPSGASPQNGSSAAPRSR
jgi:hypothetical protein